MWRIRLGETTSAGKKSIREIFEIARRETPPCILVGWGEIDLSRSIEAISYNYETKYNTPFEGSSAAQIEHYVAIKPNDIVFVVTATAKLCAIGRVIGKRYVDDEKFEISIIGGTGYSKQNPYGLVSFYNRLDVEWIFNSDVSVAIKSLTNSSELIGTLLHQYTVLPIKKSSRIDAILMMNNLNLEP
jgi:hypothetical protein